MLSMLLTFEDGVERSQHLVGIHAFRKQRHKVLASCKWKRKELENVDINVKKSFLIRALRFCLTDENCTKAFVVGVERVS